MTRELLLMRHGKSEPADGTVDFQRPLKDRGKRAAQRMGVWLLQQDLEPDHVICSPAERALVTAEKLCKAMGRGVQDLNQDARVYAAGAEELVGVLAGCPEQARRVLLVGHNPGLEDLLRWLAGDVVTVSEDGKLLPTATLARLLLPAGWKDLHPGCALLESITRPRNLPKKFPYPGPRDDELRDRPAYYYTQSAVIPYRQVNDETEILVISSSKRNHLVVPKGIMEPGLTPQQSAGREAMEEAGIEGDIDDEELGTYCCDKWGADCTVHVYAMKVTRMIPEQDWEESHRGREWLSVQQAAGSLKQPELRELVKVLQQRLST